MKLACETCPWGETFMHDGRGYRSCHHHLRAAEPEDTWYTSDYWCSLHPAAPKPIYEVNLDTIGSLRDGAGWEPVAVAAAHDGSTNYPECVVLWRRIIGYTKGGER